MTKVKTIPKKESRMGTTSECKMKGHKEKGYGFIPDSDNSCYCYLNKELLDLNLTAIEILYGKIELNIPVFRKLAEITKLPAKTLAESVFEITPKTLNSYIKEGKNIPIRVHELSLMLAELYEKGNRIFGSTDKFNDWMKRESYGLGGKKPIEFINTVIGIESIMDELISIQFGTTA